ncbi:MAG: EAL domain-containing protein [Spirochaetaceae bacterium]|nr:EAL domain-containing protein [Spirochaetaceae bacterium]
MSQKNNIEDTDLLVFEDESDFPLKKSYGEDPWKILIVDDDEQTHLVTKLALSEETIFNKKLIFLQAYDSKEAFSIIRDNRDITVILLDVVMETETAGLDLVKRIREELELHSARIIIRTGQPGYAPELEVIQEYDINDYKMKSELTRTRLLSSLISAIRSFEQYQILDQNKNGMEHMITSSMSLFSYNSIEDYSSHVLEQISRVINAECESFLCNQHIPINDDKKHYEYFIIAASRYYRDFLDLSIDKLNEEHRENLKTLFEKKISFFKGNLAYIYLQNDQHHNGALVIHTDHRITEPEQQLIKVYGIQVSVGFGNQYLLHQLHQFAYFDQLCQLPNRTKFLDEIRNRQKEKSGQVVALIDIIEFSEINNAMGYHNGDKLLKSLSARIRAHLDSDVFLARISGDTFSIIGPKEKIIPGDLLSIFKKPFTLNGTSFPLKAKLGLVHLDQQELNPEDVLQDADMALKIAKRSEGTRYRYFDSKMDEDTQNRIHITRDLKTAIDRDELLLYFQPQLDLVSHKLNGAESLIRWEKPDGELVPPSQFVHIAEQSGLIIDIGEIAIRKSLVFMENWIKEGNKPFRIGVNVSVRQFHSDNFSEFLSKTLSEFSVDPSLVELEITESMLMHDVEQGIRILNHAKGLGLSIAIDDFGTGFSSLSYLLRLPIDRLKIDRSFILNLENDKKAQRLTQLIVRMGKQLKLQLIAEGVETEEQAQFLKDLECDEVQGYLYSKPLTAADFQIWANKNMSDYP